MEETDMYEVKAEGLEGSFEDVAAQAAIEALRGEVTDLRGKVDAAFVTAARPGCSRFCENPPSPRRGEGCADLAACCLVEAG